MTIETTENKQKHKLRVSDFFGWFLTILLSAGLISILLWQPKIAKSMENPHHSENSVEYVEPETYNPDLLDSMPSFSIGNVGNAMIRLPITHTNIDTTLRTETVEHTVEEGDSIFYIAGMYGVTPDTIMWSNEDILNDNPHLIYIGQVLKIPPTDGIWYKWKASDTLEKVAAYAHLTVKDILLYVGNNFDLTNPTVEPGTFIMAPGGWREYDTSSYVPNISRDVPDGAAGVSTSAFFQCDTSGSYIPGSGRFIWPSSVHFISGNDYFAGHLAIDIGTGMGSPIYAADYGVVVYAGWMDGGYGNVVIIDHNNGYTTVYAHLDAVSVNCGNTVMQGAQIGNAGSTGNSTGAHLHFEIRYNGAWVNPHELLN